MPRLSLLLTTLLTCLLTLALALWGPFLTEYGQTPKEKLRTIYVDKLRAAMGDSPASRALDQWLYNVNGKLAGVERVPVNTLAPGGVTPAPVRRSEAVIPTGGQALLAEDGISDFELWTNPKQAGEGRLLETNGLPFSRAMQVSNRGMPANPWDVQLAAQARRGIRNGDVALLSLWVKGIRARSETGESMADVFVQRNRKPHEKLASMRVAGTSEWRQIFIPFQANTSIPEGELGVSIHLGLAEQEIAIGGVSLHNFQQSLPLAALPQTRLSYKGREEDAAWRQAAADRIKAHRMGDLEIRVLDAQGKPLLGQTIQVRMERHAFDFGSAVVAKRLCGSDGDSRRYQDFVERHLNKVTFEYDLKPGNWQENTPQRFVQSDLACAFDWLKKRNIKVRGHYAAQAALYDQERPLYRANPAGFVAGIRSHIDEKLPLIGSRVSEWDAINHLVGWGSTIADAQGAGIYADLLRQIRSAAPQGVSLWVNEAQILAGGNLRDAYEQAIQGLLQGGATPDGIGFMGHFGEMSLTGPAELYETMNRFARLVPKLQITELDIDTADDALQADYLRDVMTVAFSHPAMQGIVLWGFWERQHWKPRAAPIRSNWNERQAMAAWRDLVFKTWWTNEKGISNNDGSYRVRGFLGDYEIQVGTGAKKVVLHRTIQPGINKIEIRMD